MRHTLLLVTWKVQRGIKKKINLSQKSTTQRSQWAQFWIPLIHASSGLNVGLPEASPDLQLRRLNPSNFVSQEDLVFSFLVTGNLYGTSLLGCLLPLQNGREFLGALTMSHPLESQEWTYHRWFVCPKMLTISRFPKLKGHCQDFSNVSGQLSR